MTAVFPTLPGLAWSVIKVPRFASRIQRSVSGRELVLNDQPVPTWEFTLTFNLLRDPNDVRGGNGMGTGYNELRQLMGFFLGQQGAYQPFLFQDPSDCSVTGQVLGTGDGSATVYQLIRTMGGFNEPILAPETVATIYFNGIVQSPSGYTVNPNNGQVTFTVPPPLSQVVGADFTYYFRCRFSDDTAEFENFQYQLWSLRQIKLMSKLN
ncbi:MAG TPA: DUF2460 domain-containing protein [Stellaceae bacterium]|jgi:uncharacterized protein (TIGR02217 family)|nr:DUF2460 domain-containing protein [Stellaceae bacterium]